MEVKNGGRTGHACRSSAPPIRTLIVCLPFGMIAP